MITRSRMGRIRHTGRGDRPRMRRVVVALPSGLTLTNLFFGIFAIVAASRGEFSTAGMYVFFGGIADALDGRVARATNTGSDFGSELDSLVDIVSFGIAPALIMYFAVLNREGWDWVWSFIYVACAAIRLARFNVEQAGRAKRYFHGLPSPAAGLTLATYYWFSQTSLYSETNIAQLPWHVMLRFVMGGLSALMISDVSYPVFPPVGYKSWREIAGTSVIILAILGVVYRRNEFLFPACLAYVLYGLAMTVVLGLLGRRTPGDSPVIATSRQSIDDDDEPMETSPAVVTTAVSTSPSRQASSGDAARPTSPPRRRRRRRPPRGPRGDDGSDTPPASPPPSPPPAGE